MSVCLSRCGVACGNVHGMSEAAIAAVRVKRQYDSALGRHVSEG